MNACMPQDGHWLANSFISEVVTAPPTNVGFSAAAKKMKIPHIKNGMRTPTFEEKISDPIFLFSFFGYFCRKFCHADLDSAREQQAILLKNVEKHQAKIAFSCLSGETFGTILSRLSRLARTSRAPS